MDEGERRIDAAKTTISILGKRDQPCGTHGHDLEQRLLKRGPSEAGKRKGGEEILKWPSLESVGQSSRSGAA